MSKERGVSSEFIEQVKTANNIVSVAGRYMVLKQKGRVHWACCPFHHEKTPSFAINEQQQFYKCFGCGVGGNVITLVQKLENVDFIGAIEMLAKWAGMTMPKLTHDPDYAVKQKKKQRMLEILDTARQFYCDNLRGSGLDYLHKRNIDDELIKMFNLGLSPNWDGIVTHLKNKGFSEQEMLDSGVVAKSERGRIYDAMGGRITFAIFDIFNNCIGFTGRILPEKDNGEVAKYRNTGQTALFDKSNIVYGIDVLKKNKLSTHVDKLIIVEGNVDVISLVGAGFVNTVACMGTALTQFHARIFKRFADNVCICFDGDASGQKATLRGLDILTQNGLNVRVVELPVDADPDDFVKKNGKEAFQNLIDNAKPLIDYKLDYLEKQSNLTDNLGKGEYIKNAVSILKEISSTPEIELYVPKVSRVAGVSPESILDSIKTGSPSQAIKSPVNVTVSEQPKTADERPTKISRSLDFVVASKLHEKPYVFDHPDLIIENPLYRDALKHKISDFFDVFNSEDIARLDHLINFNFTNEEQVLAKLYQDSVNCLIKNSLQKKQAELLSQFGRTADEAERRRILIEINELKKRERNV